MNKMLDNVNEEQVLFFDIESVRASKTLTPNSKEYELFRKKLRNRETDELPSEEFTITEYNKKAALRMCHIKIVSIGVGFIKGGKVYIKALQGDEDDIIEQFCEVANKFEYVCGVNILGYDLPVIVNNGYKYFKMSDMLKDCFITGGKKPWNLEKVLDLMDLFKGAHYVNSSLDEMCYHFDIPSSKQGLDGSQVSDEYWNNGIEKVLDYVKLDVLAEINLFRRMRFEAIFPTFIDKTEPHIKLMDLIKKNGYITEKQFNKLRRVLKNSSAEEVETACKLVEIAIDQSFNLEL